MVILWIRMNKLKMFYMLAKVPQSYCLSKVQSINYLCGSLKNKKRQKESPRRFIPSRWQSNWSNVTIETESFPHVLLDRFRRHYFLLFEPTPMHSKSWSEVWMHILIRSSILEGLFDAYNNSLTLLHVNAIVDCKKNLREELSKSSHFPF